MKTLNLKQAGISLLEVLLSLSIIAIILVMATRYFFVANNNQKINILRQQLGVLIAGVEQYKTQSQGSSFGLNELYKIGALADSPYLKVNGGNAVRLYTPWSTEITLSGTSQDTIIRSANLPSDKDCEALKSSYQGTDSSKYPYLNCSAGQLTLKIR